MALDGIGLKAQADTMIKSGSIIRDSHEFSSKLQREASNITLLYVESGVVARRKTEMSEWELLPVKGLMKVHAIVPYNGFLYTRGPFHKPPSLWGNAL